MKKRLNEKVKTTGCTYRKIKTEVEKKIDTSSKLKVLRCTLLSVLFLVGDWLGGQAVGQEISYCYNRC